LSPRRKKDAILERARRVRLVVLDADGVLTDGRIVIHSDGTDSRCFSTRDGLGTRLGQRAGLRFALLSGRTSEAVSIRARELDFVDVRQGSDDKGTILAMIAARQRLPLEAVCYMGDDLVDLPALRKAGFSAAPADADPSVLEAVHWISASAGGHGAVRDLVETILRAQGRWDEVVRPIVAGS
jgi:3-deoxy-D-manno-octulosonate 8-phosphate phosphatase (KDO 8-P phosphatase)